MKKVTGGFPNTTQLHKYLELDYLVFLHHLIKSKVMLIIVDWLCSHVCKFLVGHRGKKNANCSNCDVLIISCVVHGNF